MPHTDADLDELLALATDLALEAGRILRTSGPPATIERKTSSVDLVTNLDRQVEAYIRDRLREARPGDGVLGEEQGNTEGSTNVRWLIDPIDGTTNFVYGIPGYSVSIGVEASGERVVGVVHDVGLDETFAAARGRGATLNGHPIVASTLDELSTALIGTGFSYSSEQRARQSEALTRLLPRVRDIRRRGSAALDLCWVACGRLDGYYEEFIGGDWDVAAGQVIVTEAGGVVGGLDAGPLRPPELVMAAGHALFEPLRALLVEAHAR